LADRPELPDFTAQLAAAVAPFDWHVQSPIRQALQMWNDGGPWQLDWTLLSPSTNSITTAAMALPQIENPAAGATRQVAWPRRRYQP
ncbi:MAG TPA: hypothetical protein VMH87_00420, partial [Pseudomonadales bacterium]|nr:hypothetical protein [Pseudomonadales bacterium]